MAFGYLIAGFCFFFLPNFAMWDFIPDCIGAFLIVLGISRAAHLAPVMEEAKRAFVKLFYITLFRIVSAFLVEILFSSTSAQGEGYVTLFTVVFCGFECFYFIVAMRAFTQGISYLQMRNGSIQTEKHLTDFYTLSCAFVLVKSVLNVLPTLHGLFGVDYTSNVETLPIFNIEYYTRLLTLFNIVFVTALGIVWLVFGIRLLLNVKKDTTLQENIDIAFYDILTASPTLLLRGAIRVSFLLLSAAFFFLLDLSIDKINILPDPIAALLLLFAAIILVRQKLLPKMMYFLCGAALALSIVSEITSDLFAYDHADVVLYYGLNYTKESLILYVLSGVFQVLWQLSLIAILFFLCKMLFEIIKAHTGSLSGDQKEETLLHQTLYSRVRTMFVLFCIYLLSCAVHAFLFPFLQVYWLFHILFGIVCVFYAIYTLSIIREQVEYKYL